MDNVLVCLATGGLDRARTMLAGFQVGQVDVYIVVVQVIVITGLNMLYCIC